jgi:ADP-heptose:LPS heptosyltransferase
MKTVIISPYSKPLPNGNNNAKNYPYWEDMVVLLKNEGYHVIQIGQKNEKPLKGVDEIKVELSFKELEKLVSECFFWMSVDSFFQHFCTYHKRRGVVIFGKSDPNIFGYKSNLNIYKDESCFRKQQFAYWFDEPFDANVFVKPDIIMKKIKDNFK